MNTFVGVIVGIVGLGFLVLVHELGHFIVAKATKMRVEEFSIGFGPYLVQRRWGETVYGISAFPLGGYVRVTGMHKEEFEQRIQDLREQEMEDAERLGSASADRSAADQTAPTSTKKKGRKPRDPEDVLAGKRAITSAEVAATPLERRFYAHPLWHKLLFIVAGVVMNALVALALLYVVGVVDGETKATAVVGSVEPGSGAAQAGVQVGDRIVSIDGDPIADWDALRWAVINHKGDTVTLVVERAGAIITLDKQATIGENSQGLGMLGISWGGELVHRDLGAAKSFGYAARQFGSIVRLTVDGIGLMFKRTVPVVGSSGVAGVIGIVQISGQAVSEGFTVFLFFVALISINLALLNILPLLPLDGGHVVMVIIERIRRRPVSLKVFERISMVGLALFGILFLVSVYNDIGRIVTGG